MKMKMKKNRGQSLLGEEFSKILIAAICIFFLVALLIAVFFSQTNNEQIKEAQNIVNGDHGISSEVRRIEAGGDPLLQGFFVPNPSGWYIYGFSGNVKKPNSCSGNNCVCVCEGVFIDLFDAQIKNCDNTGSCTSVPDLKAFDRIKIENSGVYIYIQKIYNNLDVSSIKPQNFGGGAGGTYSGGGASG